MMNKITPCILLLVLVISSTGPLSAQAQQNDPSNGAAPQPLYLGQDIKPDGDGVYAIPTNTTFAIELEGDIEWNNSLPLRTYNTWSLISDFDTNKIQINNFSEASKPGWDRVRNSIQIYEFLVDTWLFDTKNIGEAVINFKKTSSYYAPLGGSAPNSYSETSFKIRVY